MDLGTSLQSKFFVVVVKQTYQGMDFNPNRTWQLGDKTKAWLLYNRKGKENKVTCCGRKILIPGICECYLMWQKGLWRHS